MGLISDAGRRYIDWSLAKDFTLGVDGQVKCDLSLHKLIIRPVQAGICSILQFEIGFVKEFILAPDGHKLGRLPLVFIFHRCRYFIKLCSRLGYNDIIINWYYFSCFVNDGRRTHCHDWIGSLADIVRGKFGFGSFGSVFFFLLNLFVRLFQSIEFFSQAWHFNYGLVLFIFSNGG